jgi:hypothetical protein
MRRQLGLSLLALSIVMVALLASIPRSHVKADDNQQGSIVGTWFNTVLLNTPSGSVPFLTELVSFNPGGTLINTNSINFNAQNPALTGTPLAANFSDAYGTWKQVEDSNQFAITFKGFIFAGANTPTAVYGSFFPGENVGVFTVEAVATLQTTASGQTLTGPFTNQVANLQGMVVFAGSGTFSATRLQIQPLATP